MRKCIVGVQGPLQLIAGLIAMEWYGRVRYGSPNADAILVLFDFGVSRGDELTMFDAIMHIASARNWSKVLFIDSQEMRGVTRHSIRRSIQEMRSRIGCQQCDELYVARDYGHMGNQLLLNAYPEAARIIYGDSLGIVGDEESLETSFGGWLRAPLDHLKLALRKLVLGCPSRLSFDAALLVLPQDWTGRYLDRVPLIVPAREHVVEMIQSLSRRFPELHIYCDALFPDQSAGAYLYLLSNLANSGLASQENEVLLYEEVIRQTAPTGSLVLLKNHPRSSAVIINALSDRLEKDYRVTHLDDPRFNKLPIELWSTLIARCHIIPVFSTSATHISFIYSKKVLVPLDEYKIIRYFYPDKWNFMRKSNSMILETLSALDRWDGTSSLWNGK